MRNAIFEILVPLLYIWNQNKETVYVNARADRAAPLVSRSIYSAGKVVPPSAFPQASWCGVMHWNIIKAPIPIPTLLQQPDPCSQSLCALPSSSLPAETVRDMLG